MSLSRLLGWLSVVIQALRLHASAILTTHHAPFLLVTLHCGCETQHQCTGRQTSPLQRRTGPFMTAKQQTANQALHKQNARQCLNARCESCGLFWPAGRCPSAALGKAQPMMLPESISVLSATMRPKTKSVIRHVLSVTGQAQCVIWVRCCH